MAGKDLRNKPLIEALIEVKWQLITQAPGIQIDPHYKILLGRLYDKVRDQYPEHEQLPTATMPDEIAGYTVQHRFRQSKGDWPLIQVGPGILTVNDTHKYTWTDFRIRANQAVERLFDAHPKSDALKVNSLLLRYIDAVDFDYTRDDVFAFLHDKMRVFISLPGSLFANAEIQKMPRNFSWQSEFTCSKPPGTVMVRFATGQKPANPCLLWETMVHSGESQVPMIPGEFESWIDAAHKITHDWFFKLIEGELERRFSGD